MPDHAATELEKALDNGTRLETAVAEPLTKTITENKRAMNGVREVADTLEGIVPHDVWPLATYREMLFIR